MLRSRNDEPSSPAFAGDATERAEVRLLGAIAAGERAAFEALYRSYHPRLTRFLDRMTRRPALVEEVLDDTMLVVWRRADRYNGRSKVSTWIFAIAYRTALKALQRFDEAIDDDAAEARACLEPGPEQWGAVARPAGSSVRRSPAGCAMRAGSRARTTARSARLERDPCRRARDRWPAAIVPAASASPAPPRSPGPAATTARRSVATTRDSRAPTRHCTNCASCRPGLRRVPAR